MFCCQVEIQLRFPDVISSDMFHWQMIYGHEGALNDNRVKSHLSHFWLGIISNTVFLIWVYSLWYSGMNENRRQTMVIFHRRPELDGRTKTDFSPHGRIRTRDHDYFSYMDGGGLWTKTDRLSHGRIQATDIQKYKKVDGDEHVDRWTKVRP